MKIAKKLLSLLLAILVITSSLTIVFADNLDGIFTIIARNYIPGGEGEAFHDSADCELTEKKPEYWAHGGIMLRKAEWIKYELPEDMRVGTYKVFVNAANNIDAKLNLKVNDKFIAKETLIPKTTGPDGQGDGSWQYFTKREICQVYITEESKILTVEYADVAITVKDIIFEFVSEENFNEGIYHAYAEEVISGGEGVGFHDNGASHRDGTADCMEVFHKGDIMLRASEWCAYSFNVNKTGTYSVKINAANHHPVKMTVASNGLKTKPTDIPGSLTPSGAEDTDWAYYTERELETIVLKKGENIVTFYSNAAVTYTDFTITYVSPKIEYKIPFESLYSCVNNGVSGSDNLSTPEISKISDAGGILPYKMLIMRAKSNFTFDISSFVPGSYSLSQISASKQDQKVDIYSLENATDEGMIISYNTLLPATGSWTTYQKTEDVTEFYLPQNTNYIKFDIVSGANQLDYFVFTYISQDVESHVVPYYRTISETVGEGFYAGKVTDASGTATDRETFEEPILKRDSLAAAMRKGYYMVYDVSYLPEGYYYFNVYGATYQEGTAVDVYVNDELQIDDGDLGVSGTHSDLYKYTKLSSPGVLYLPKGNKSVKISAENLAFNLRNIEFSARFISPDFTVYNSDDELADSVNEGKMQAYANLNDFYSGEEILFIFAIYREDANGVKKLYKLDAQISSVNTDFMGLIEGIELEDGYTYSYNVFTLKKTTLSGYSIN